MNRKYGKKVLSASISLALALSLMPSIVMAEEVETEVIDVIEIADGVEESINVVIPGVYTAADILEASEATEETPVEEDAETEATEAADEEATEDTPVEVIAETEEPEEAEEVIEETVAEEIEETAGAGTVSADTKEKLSAEEEILVKYLGSSDLSEDEIYDMVYGMEADELDAAYAEIEEYAMSLTEEELDKVSEALVTLANAIEEATSVSLFTNENLPFGNVLVDVADSNGTGSQDGNTATISVTGGLLSTKKTTINVYNNSDKAAIISFDYSVNSNTDAFTIAGAASTSGSYKATLASGAYVTLVLTAKGGYKKATLTMSNISITEAASTSNVTFLYDSASGSITVDGEAVASGTTLSVDYEQGAAVTATPVSGVTFMGWANADTGEIIAADGGVIRAGEDITVKAIFAGKNACFKIGTTYLFDDLNKATEVASKQSSKVIVLANNGTLPAGTYTIPAGVTLLIPFDDANSLYTNEPQVVATGLLGILNSGYVDGSYSKPTIYRTLTMASGANLIINGALSVSNRIFSGNAGMQAGSPTGPISMIKMEDGSDITVNNGGAAYVYGYVYGAGEVLVKSGATVYECMQIMDFRGGDATTDMAASGNPGVFPFSQYYVQNIEVNTTYEGGAKEFVVSSFTISKMKQMAAVPFIGPSGCMFIPETGTRFSKRFDPATGRTIVTVNGNFSMSPMKASLGSTDIDTADYVLPIASTLTINMESGTATINQDMALLPSAELNVGKNAVLNITDGHTAYAYDADEWLGNGFIYRRNDAFSDGNQSWLQYTATTTSTKQTLKDSKIDVNGEIIGNGYLYTTAGGAQVISSEGTGVVTLLNWDDTEKPVTYQGYQYADPNNTSDQKVDYIEIPVTSVKLMNGDGTYTETVNVAAGITPMTGKYLYEDNKWIEWRPGIYFDANGGDGVMDPQYSDRKTSITLEANEFTRAGYDFMGWSITPDGDVTFSDGAIVGVVEDEITLYAVWEKAACEHKTTVAAVPAEDPTCSEPGTTAGLKCSDCQLVLVEPEEIPADPDAHSFTSYTYNNDAKCGVDGTKTATCGHGCGATETVVAEGTALSHSFTNYEADNNATATEYGTRTAKCDHNCGETDTVIDLGEIDLTYTSGEGMVFEAVVKGYKGTGRLYVGIYNSTGRLLSASFAAVNADNKATVTFGKVDGAAYAKVLAWDAFSKAVADYKVQNL